MGWRGTERRFPLRKRGKDHRKSGAQEVKRPAGNAASKTCVLLLVPSPGKSRGHQRGLAFLVFKSRRLQKGGAGPWQRQTM